MKPEDAAWSLAAAKARARASTNPDPSCRSSKQHLTSQYGNFCFMCCKEMPTPHFYPAAKVTDFPGQAVDDRVGAAGGLL